MFRASPWTRGVLVLSALVLVLACGSGGPSEKGPYIAALPDTVRMVEGGTTSLAVVAYDEDDNPLLEQPVFTYVSNSPFLLTVDESGEITSIGDPGSGSVTVTGGDEELTVPVLIAGIPADTVLATTSIGGAPYSVAVSSTGKMILSLPGTTNVVRGDLPAYTFPTTINTEIIQPLGVAMDPAGTLAYVGLPNGIAVVNLANNTITHPISEAQVGQIFSLLVSPSGSRLYASGTNGKVYSIIPANNTVVDSTDVIGIVEQMVYHPTTDRIYGAVGDRSIELNPSTMNVSRSFAAGGKSIALSPDGSTAYTISESQSLRAINLSNGRVTPVETLTGFGVAVRDDYVIVSNSHAIQFVDRNVRVVVKSLGAGTNNRRPTVTSSGMVIVPDEDGAVRFVH